MARKATVLVLALSTLAFGGCATWDRMTGKDDAAKATGDTSAVPSFSRADKDGSGAVDRGEAAGISGLDFSSADKDNDGRLSRSEYESATKSK